MKHNILYTLIFLFAVSCVNNQNLSVNVDGLGDDTILVEYLPISEYLQIDEPYRDTIYSNNDKFSFNSPLDETILAIFYPRKAEFKRVDGSYYRPTQIIALIKPNDKLCVKGELKEFYLEYSTYGSNFNEEFTKVRNQYAKEISEAVKIELQIDTLMFKHGDRELINRLFQERNKIKSISTENELDYAKNNWDKELSAFFLIRQRLDTIGKYYGNVDANIKNGIFKNPLERQYFNFEKYVKTVKAEENIIVGNDAPDFSLKSISGNVFEFSSIKKDKYIVLDFWGSWCGPCIQGIPKMKEIYELYKNQIEIIGIACNDTEDNWKGAVKNYELDWINVLNNENDIEKDVSILYAIQGFPTKILINPDGKIVGIFNGEGDDFYNRIHEILKS